MTVVDNTTDALADWWHPVATCGEVGAEPVRIEVLGQAWALVRIGGTVRAYRDACPHRGVRLSAGVVVPGPDGIDVLQCRYHGWCFDGAGACVHAPSVGSGLSSDRYAATVGRVQEAVGLVWLAPREPRADLLGFPEADDPAFAVQALPPRRARLAAAHLMENNFDFSHIPFVHTESFGEYTTLPAPESVGIARDGWELEMTYDARLSGGRWSPTDVAAHRSWARGPFSSRLRVEFPGGVVHSWYMAIRPETATTSVVYQLIAANDVASPDELRGEVEFNSLILDEDVGVLELIDDPGLDLGERAAHVAADRSAVAYRRLLRDIVRAGDVP